MATLSAHLEQKYRFASLVLGLGTLLLPILAYLDYQQGFLAAAIAKGSLALLCPPILYLARRRGWQRGLSRFTAISLLVMSLFGAMTKLVSPYGLIWVPVLPLLFIYIAGRRLGLLLLTLYQLVFSLAYFFVYQAHHGQGLSVYLQTLLAYLLVTTVALVYEHGQWRMRVDLQQQAECDFLTGSMNRRGLMRRIEAELSNALRYKVPFSLILLDLDDFKQVNDRLGHDTGDRVLQELVQRITATLRPSDQIGRWGGEEFLLILPHARLEVAAMIAERLRKVLAERPFTAGIGVTASLGVAEYREQEPMASMLQRVDQMLYLAKQGKNRVVVKDPTGEQ